ncbi:MAG: M2 family metallopeptidase [Bacteroidetes bacterium]|nr:M2 family metallopeptidase [Bacteroidota bacterium]
MKNELSDFIRALEEKLVPLSQQTNLAYWNAAISGDDEDFSLFEDLSVKLTEVYSDKRYFRKLKKIKDSGAILDSLDQRQLHLLYDAFLDNQATPSLMKRRIKLETEIEKKYNNFRVTLKGHEINDNEVEDILKKSISSEEVKEAWEAHKQIGPLVSKDILKLVKLRNQISVKLGFNNYHEMSLMLNDQHPAEVSTLFDELDSLTHDVFVKLKIEIDTFLSNKFSVPQEDLCPWHYQNRYFQEAPVLSSLDLDHYFVNKNLEVLTTEYYKGIGLDITDLIAKSDLYDKPGKNQHAFCINIDNSGDVRVLCNLKSNQYWMNTMLHEFGHGVYDKYIDQKLPYTLREPSHIFTTEAIAMLFGRFSTNPQWLQDMIGITDEEKISIAEACFSTLRTEQLVFSRWVQVVYRFEKSMYEDPDQDLNTLWWDLVEKYQMIKRPKDRDKPDWATKIHIATSPCYYHNYLLGELLASQLLYYIANNVIHSENVRFESFANKKEVGAFLIEKIFKPGSVYHWSELIEKATGEPLSARYYAKQFIN